MGWVLRAGRAQAVSSLVTAFHRVLSPEAARPGPACASHLVTRHSGEGVLMGGRRHSPHPAASDLCPGPHCS